MGHGEGPYYQVFISVDIHTSWLDGEIKNISKPRSLLHLEGGPIFAFGGVGGVSLGVDPAYPNAHGEDFSDPPITGDRRIYKIGPRIAHEKRR